LLIICQGLYEDLKQHIQPRKEMRVYIHGASSSEAVGEVGTKKLSLLAIERLYPREVYGLYYGDDIDDSDEIIYETWVVKPVSSRQFSQPGDSGAWVLNDNAELVGMLLGLWTPRNGAPPLSFFTSWSSVADCIEANSRVRTLAERSSQTDRHISLTPNGSSHKIWNLH
jgi:hypothetical protein